MPFDNKTGTQNIALAERSTRLTESIDVLLVVGVLAGLVDLEQIVGVEAGPAQRTHEQSRLRVRHRRVYAHVHLQIPTIITLSSSIL